MTGFVVRQFKGIAPKLAPRLLNDNMAQTCTNARFKSGTLVPLRANTAVMTLPKSGPITTIHRFGQDVAADNQYWFHWASDVDVARGFVAGDTQERTYWTGDGAPKVADSANALTGGTSYPMAAWTLGVPAPTTAPSGVVGGTPTSATALEEDRVYVVTFVTAWGEEGCPSDVSNTCTVQVGETVTLTLPAIPGGTYNFAAKRIYRSVAGASTSTFLYVGEVPHTATVAVDAVLASDASASVAVLTSGTTYSITGGLGEEIASMDYQMPPSGLQGLTAGPNGVMGGFKGNDVYFCEPYKPHAFPEKYILTVDAQIVGLAVFDTTWIVLTKSQPYLINGSHPENYSMVRSELAQACVSKPSIAAADGGVIYATPDGLFLVGGGVTRNLTEAILSRKEWQALTPSTLRGYIVDNQYVGFYGGTAGFVLDLATGDLSALDWYASAGYYDPIRDALFLVTGGTALVKFDAGSALTQTWRSKVFYSPHEINMGAARVEAADYPVTFKTYADGALKHTETVANGDAFRLPSGFTAKPNEFEVSGTFEIYSAGFAETVQELASG